MENLQTVHRDFLIGQKVFIMTCHQAHFWFLRDHVLRLRSVKYLTHVRQLEGLGHCYVIVDPSYWHNEAYDYYFIGYLRSRILYGVQVAALAE